MTLRHPPPNRRFDTIIDLDDCDRLIGDAFIYGKALDWLLSTALAPSAGQQINRREPLTSRRWNHRGPLPTTRWLHSLNDKIIATLLL